jgi:hypothetical protein
MATYKPGMFIPKELFTRVYLEARPETGPTWSVCPCGLIIESTIHIDECLEA